MIKDPFGPKWILDNIVLGGGIYVANYINNCPHTHVYNMGGGGVSLKTLAQCRGSNYHV